MADLSVAIARLIAELSAPAAEHIAPKQALADVWNALDQMNLDPEVARELRQQVDNARRAGMAHLNGTPLVFLEALLQSIDRKGGAHNG